MTEDLSHFFTAIDEQADIRQGDVIFRSVSQPTPAQEYGIIANADCDLAQKKNGGTFTWLKVVPLSQYYDNHWAPEKAAKIIEKQLNGILTSTNSQIARINSKLKPLDDTKLISWVTSDGAESIIKVLDSAKHPMTEDLKAKLRAIDLLTARDGHEVGIKELKKAAPLLKIHGDTIKSDMEKAFSNSGGFPDYFVLPELPSTKGIGFIALLRELSVVQASDVYKTELEARIADSPTAFRRIGRLSDRVRYGIMQKLGFLFMRIGDHPSFESACKASYGIVIEEITGAEK
ncbi:MAG TPA: hypothetical protein VK195_17165 [Burkholderiaceae bacterium]|nr:hypothetical protein [Burkholderiaceae bacterium]